jgi:hypothetical protein
MMVSGRARTAAVVLASLVVLATVVFWQMVSAGKQSIQRGAHWTGVSLNHDGLAIVYLCDPDSGIRHAYFFLWPFGRVSLEKIDGG